MRVSVRLQAAIESQQRIEHSRHVRQASLEVTIGAMKHFLQTTHHRQERQYGFDQHAFIPCAPWTEFQIVRHAGRTVEACVSKNDAISDERFDQRQEGLVMHVGCVPSPIHHFPAVVEQPAQLDIDDPALVGLALLANLLRATSFADGVDKFDAISVDHREESGGCQKLVAPALMCGQQPLQACPMGQSFKNRLVGAFEPAVENAKVAAFEREQKADAH